MIEKNNFFKGILKKIYETPNVIKFAIGDQRFISFAQSNQLFIELIGIIAKNDTNIVSLSIPVIEYITDNFDKEKQIIITNHTKILFKDKIIYYPMSTYENDKKLFIEESKQKVSELEQKHIAEKKEENYIHCPHCQKIIYFVPGN